MKKQWVVVVPEDADGPMCVIGPFDWFPDAEAEADNYPFTAREIVELEPPSATD